MTIFSRLLLLFLMTWISWTAGVAQNTPGQVGAPLRDDFEGILYFLSSDWMEGRETGTRGADMAADYIASMMQLNGLQPFGDSVAGTGNGSLSSHGRTWLQVFKAVRCSVGSSSLVLKQQTPQGESIILFTPGTDYRVDPVPLSRESEAPLLFAGYGIEFSEMGYNDYAGIDARNRIVVILDGSPGHTDTTSPAWKKLGTSFGHDHATWKKKMECAERHGAAAVILVDPAVINDVLKIPVPDEDDFGSPRHFLPGDTGVINIPCFIPEASAISKLFDSSEIDLKSFEKRVSQDVKPASGDMKGKKVKFSITIQSEELLIKNVLGKISGTDSSRNIIIGGHYDHLGLRKGEAFNGADDNASGVAGTLALAKAWAKFPAKPPCNLIFAAWVGEEHGRLGSRYFVRNSPLMPDRISLVINMDMISRNAPEDTMHTAVSIGTRTINEDLRNVARKINSTLIPPFKLELWDVTNASGSDYAPFAGRSVPILTFHAGFPAEYHTPRDDFSLLDLSKMEKIIYFVNETLKEALKTPPQRGK